LTIDIIGCDEIVYGFTVSDIEALAYVKRKRISATQRAQGI